MALNGIDDNFLIDWYPVLDKQIGDVVYINGMDAYLSFNADLINIVPTVEDPEYTSIMKPGGNTFNVLNYKFKPCLYDFSFYIGGVTYENAMTNVNRILQQLKNCTVKTSIDDSLYTGIMRSYTCESTGVYHYQLLTVTLEAIRSFDLVKVDFNGDVTIDNPGTVSSGLKISFKPGKVIETFTVYGVTIKKIKGVGSVVIDGIEGKVTENGVNKFADTDIINFPKIEPGLNTVSCSDGTIPVTLEYYPTFYI